MSILAFSNLSYSYDKKKNIFCDISAEMELGKIYAILGPSGCGKTTLLSLLGGLDSLAKGKILFNGEDITEKDSQIIAGTMFPLFFKHIISLII